MRISHYFEWERWITGGQKQSVRNQRKILERRDVDFTTDPDLSADILHLNNMGPRSVYYARKARKKDVSVVIHTHQTAKDLEGSFVLDSLISRLSKPYLSYAYGIGDQLVCPSEYNRKEIEDYCEVDKQVISNGFDPEKLEGYRKLREEYLERYDLEPPVVFNVGHVLERKGLETFIETARQMPDTDFVWFGFLNPLGGGLAGELLRGRRERKLVRESPENCKFTGYIKDVRGAFAAGDIFFFPTHNENEGMALLEAMHAGKPVVVRDIETYNWMKHGRECLKADKGFEDSIRHLKEDEDLRSELGSQAERISGDFRLEEVGDRLVELYRDVI